MGAFASEIYTRLSDAVENLTDGFAIYDAQGRLVLSNPAHRRLAFFDGLKRLPGEPATSPRMVSEEVQLPDERWLAIREIHTRSGDVVCVEPPSSGARARCAPPRPRPSAPAGPSPSSFVGISPVA